MELKIKVELDMTERMSGLVTGLIGLLEAPLPPKGGETTSAPRGADPTTDALPVSEKPAPYTEQQPEAQPEKVEADQMKGVIEVTIAKFAGQEWKEKPSPESQKKVLAVSGVLKQIARCVSDQTVEKPTELEGQQRVRFVKELDNIFTDSQGMPQWNPF